MITSNLVDNWNENQISDNEHEFFDGIEVYRCRGNFVFKNYMVSSQIFKRLVAIKADLVHIHGYGFFHSDITAFVSKLRGMPYVVTSHAFYPAVFFLSKVILGAYNLSIGKIGLHGASKCIALNPYYAKMFRKFGVPEKRIKIIPNGVNLDSFLKLPNFNPILGKYGIDGKLITFIGRLDDVKSPAVFVLIKAFSELVGRYPKLKLAILGPDWGYLSKLKKRTINLGLQNSVIFGGKISELEKMMFLSRSNIGAVVSLNEAFSLVLLEFMASGKPVIVSRVGGLPSIICEGQGLLVDNDSVSMKLALQKLLSDETYAKSLGEKGRKQVFS